VSTGLIRDNMRERAMNFLPTTATAVEKLKRQAKDLRRTTGTSLAVAQDAVAKQHGYMHWKHVTECLKRTPSHRHNRPLPKHLLDWLDRAAASDPAPDSTREAFDRGFVFAIDVKESENLTPHPEYIECEDGWHIAARQLWQSLVQKMDADSVQSAFERLTPEGQLRTVLDALTNYRFFQYVGLHVPSSPENAFKHARSLTSCPPTHVWIKGRFVDVSELAEVRIDGQVDHSPNPGTHTAMPEKGRTRLEKFGHLLNKEERILFGSMSVSEQEGWLFELEKRTRVGRSRYRPVSTSVTMPWKDASKT